MNAMEQSASNDLQGMQIKIAVAAAASTATTADGTIGIDSTAVEGHALPAVGTTATTAADNDTTGIDTAAVERHAPPLASRTVTTAVDAKSVETSMKRSTSSVVEHDAVTSLSSACGGSIVTVHREDAADECSVAPFATVTGSTASSEKPHLQVYLLH
jgi:hypothetical protein